jgi:hypothetical protein
MKECRKGKVIKEGRKEVKKEEHRRNRGRNGIEGSTYIKGRKEGRGLKEGRRKGRKTCINIYIYI